MYRDAGASYVTSARPSWRELVMRVRAVQMELKRDDPGRAVGLAGNPAAPESALIVAELRLGRQLPPSYREFLAFCDGWPNFFDGASLLGTGEIGRRGCEVAAARMLPERCLLPFGSDSRGACLFAFDTRVRLSDGELPVVAWMGGLGIDCRCFTGFLATLLQLCRAELAQVKARALPESAGRPEVAENRPSSSRQAARLRDERPGVRDFRGEIGAHSGDPRTDLGASGPHWRTAARSSGTRG